MLGFAGELASANAPAKSRAGFAFAGDDPKQFAPSFPGAVASLPILAESAAGLGAVNWLPERDQIVRRVPLVFSIGGTLQPSLSLEALRVATGASTVMIKASGGSGVSAFGEKTGIELVRAGDVILPTDASGELWLKFTRSDPKRYISRRIACSTAASIPRRSRAAYIFIGSSAAGLLDLRATPLDASVPGVEIHAQAVEQMLAGEHLQRPAYATGAELVFLVLSRHRPRLADPQRRPRAGGHHRRGLHRGRDGVLVARLHPRRAAVRSRLSGAGADRALSRDLARHLHQDRERARPRALGIRPIRARPPSSTASCRNPSGLKLGGETREVTVLFSDVRGFSRISEGMTPEELIDFVNKLFSPLTDIIYEEGGTVDKYMGDAVMAFWNAPLDVPDHATRAARAALRMQAALKDINRVIAEDAIARGAKPAEARLGIGINTGPASSATSARSRRRTTPSSATS